MRQTILIVDDTPLNIKILSDSLRQTYHILVATHGLKALELAQSAKPDLIILDIMMPDMDGFAVCRELKRNPSTMAIPVMFATAKDEPDDELKGLNMGAVDYLYKPFRIPVIKSRIRAQLDLVRAYALLDAKADLDGLTELFCRRRLEQQLPTEWQRAQENNSHLALILVEVDEFHTYTEHYGHADGDARLRDLATCLTPFANRTRDILVRYQGHTFALLLPNMPPDALTQLTENIRTTVEKTGFPHQTSRLGHLSISIGGASLAPQHEEHPDRMLKIAEAALNIARKGGNLCVLRP